MASIVAMTRFHRAPFKVSSAFLEAIHVGNVALDRENHTLLLPFIVLAICNPEDVPDDLASQTLASLY